MIFAVLAIAAIVILSRTGGGFGLLGTSATHPATGTARPKTQAGTNTSVLSAVEKALLGGGRASANPAAQAPKSSGGGGGGLSLGGGGGATQTGNVQPSNQSVTTAPNWTAYGKNDADGSTVYIDDQGNVYDSNGNILTDLSGITPLVADLGSGPSQIVQVAPGGAAGDAVVPNPTLLNDPSGVGDISGLFVNGGASSVPQLDTSGNQDVALAQDAASGDFAVPDFVSPDAGVF